MNCVCGHPEKDHVPGRCCVPDCPCERFQPGDTLGAVESCEPGPDSGHLVCCGPTWCIMSVPPPIAVVP